MTKGNSRLNWYFLPHLLPSPPLWIQDCTKDITVPWSPSVWWQSRYKKISALHPSFKNRHTCFLSSHYSAPAPNGLTSLRIDSAQNLRDIYALTINAQKTFISQMWLIKMIEPPAKTVCDQNWRPSTLESPLCTHAFIFTWGLNSIDN